MFTPIPKRILTDTAVLCVPTSIDVYQNATSTSYVIKNCHLQDSNETKKTADNTEVVLRSVLFIDSRLSAPQYDIMALQDAAHAAGGVMTCMVTDKRGKTVGTFTVLTVDTLTDDCGNLHHTELGLA